MQSTLDSNLWNEGLKLVSFCPVCETRFNSMQARILAREGETHLLHVVCRKCHNSILALVVVNDIGASSVGLLTDLSFEDVMHFRFSESITLDDVIETHAFFEHPQWNEQVAGSHRIEQEKSMSRRTKKVQMHRTS